LEMMDRADALEAVKDERADRREVLRGARDLPGKLGRKASVLFLDRKRFEEWLEERGGDEGAIGFLCAQVASGVRLRVMCVHYGIEYGLLWEWMSRDAARLDRYYRAQVGLADDWVSEVVEIADGADAETLAVDKWRGEARLKVAPFYDRARFGAKEVVLGAGLENLAVVLERISQRRLDAGRAGDDATVIDAEPIESEAAGAIPLAPAADEDDHL
jgi:hypothetical protein